MRKSEQCRNFFCQHLSQLSMTFAGQVHEIHLVELAVLCIQEVHVLARADDAELLGHTGGFLHTAVAHDRVMEPGPDGRRCHHQNVGLFGAPAVHALGLEDQALHTGCNAGGVGPKAFLSRHWCPA